MAGQTTPRRAPEQEQMNGEANNRTFEEVYLPTRISASVVAHVGCIVAYYLPVSGSYATSLVFSGSVCARIGKSIGCCLGGAVAGTVAGAAVGAAVGSTICLFRRCKDRRNFNENETDNQQPLLDA